mgnify:CR=1 FL=1
MKWLLQVILVVLTSFYIFPIEFRVLPSANTKMLMAVLGVMVFIINSIMKRENILPKKVVTVGLCALLVSFVGIISVLYNADNKNRNLSLTVDVNYKHIVILVLLRFNKIKK